MSEERVSGEYVPPERARLPKGADGETRCPACGSHPFGKRTYAWDCGTNLDPRGTLRRSSECERRERVRGAVAAAGFPEPTDREREKWRIIDEFAAELRAEYGEGPLIGPSSELSNGDLVKLLRLENEGCTIKEGLARLLETMPVKLTDEEVATRQQAEIDANAERRRQREMELLEANDGLEAKVAKWRGLCEKLTGENARLRKVLESNGAVRTILPVLQGEIPGYVPEGKYGALLSELAVAAQGHERLVGEAAKFRGLYERALGAMDWLTEQIPVEYPDTDEYRKFHTLMPKLREALR